MDAQPEKTIMRTIYFDWNKRNIMWLMNYLPVVIAVAFCAVGVLALVIIGFVLAGVAWGFKRGNVRVVTGQRNFDDFGR
jgi:hypothetical protein